MQPPKIVLASSSSYRIALLKRWGLDFVAESPDIDESPLPGETPKELVLRLSQAKAEVVASKHADALVIGSDQVAVLESPQPGEREGHSPSHDKSPQPGEREGHSPSHDKSPQPGEREGHSPSHENSPQPGEPEGQSPSHDKSPQPGEREGHSPSHDKSPQPGEPEGQSPSHENSEILGKPGTKERAIAQLTNASGRTLVFLTGLALVDGRSGQCHTHVDETRVTFRSLSRSEIERYVDLDQPLDCAGAIKSESMGSLLFERVETVDPSAGIGLPLIKLGDLLRRAGASPLGQTD